MWRYPTSPVITSSPRRTIFDKYCSCEFQVIANDYRSGYQGVPEAICSSSIFNRRGLRGPGQVRCRYFREYLEERPTDQLYYYALAKGLIPEGSRVTRDQLIDLLIGFFEKE